MIDELITRTLHDNSGYRVTHATTTAMCNGRAFAKPPQKRTFGGSNSRASFDALECPVGAG